MQRYLLMPLGLRLQLRWFLPLFGAIYRHSGHSITTETTKSTRAPESMASRRADIFKGSCNESGSYSPRAHLWGSGSHGRTFGQTSIRI